jgi:DNA-binding transcriptional regulator/RsmH inhibitor MraZ
MMIVIPDKFRKLFGRFVFISRYLDSRLVIYNEEGFKKMQGAIESQMISDSSSFSKFLLSGIEERVLNEKGEVSIPAYLMEFLGSEGDLVFTQRPDGITLRRKTI